MKFPDRNQSLKGRFKDLSIRWSFAGLLMSSVLVAPIVVLAIKHSSERQVEVMATALTRAFRPMILSSQIRDAKLQMEAVAQLQKSESIDVLDSDFKPVLIETPLADKKLNEHCEVAGKPCWFEKMTKVSISQPIYFNDDTKGDIYGYLTMNLKPTVDFTEIILILFFGGLIFLVQVRGMYSALKREGLHIEYILRNWKLQIERPEVFRSHGEGNGLLSEFLPLDKSIQALHGKISQLELNAANAAASKAKIDMVRGIGHDLKTPLSQLSKFFAIFVSNTQKNKEIDQLEVYRIESIFTRMGSLIRQVTNLDRKPDPDCITDLNLWVKNYYSETVDDPERMKDNVRFEIAHPAAKAILVGVHETDLYRLIDNLVRNSLEAFAGDRSAEKSITLSLDHIEDFVELGISDNGNGIPACIQNKIFDLDFTTKKVRGTGLGLGIVQKICDELGLQLSYKSSVNQGTKFKIKFPIKVTRKLNPNFYSGEAAV